MALFERFHISVGDLESRLNRKLGGDPSGGERALVGALNANRLDDVERLLVQDKALKEDFRTVIEEHLRRARQRWSEHNLWTVELSARVFEAYRAEAWKSGGRVSLGTVLSRELTRNLARREIEEAAWEAVRTGDLAPLRAVLENAPTAAGSSGVAVH